MRSLFVAIFAAQTLFFLIHPVMVRNLMDLETFPFLLFYFLSLYVILKPLSLVNI